MRAKGKRARMAGLAAGALVLAPSVRPAVPPPILDTLSTIPNWSVSGPPPHTGLGFSVKSAGDVNGDGYADVIVGAPFGFESQAFVYHGSSLGLSTTPSWTTEAGGNCVLGWSVAGAGDVNGDGYDDVIVGSVDTDPPCRQALVFHGSAAGLGSSPAWVATGDRTSDVSVGTAGDVNGDGYDDVVVGFNRYQNGQEHEGRVLVYHGSRQGLSPSPDWAAEGDQAFGWFGASVGTAGDVNGDGYDDVVVGAPSTFWDGPGRAFLYQGSPGGLATAPAWTVSGVRNDALGTSAGTAGDVNGDGYDDVILGAPYFTDGHSREGRTSVYLGSASGLSYAPTWTIESQEQDAALGWSVASAGDVNRDGYGDAIVGTRGQESAGQAIVYLGSPAGPRSSRAWQTRGEPGAFYGHASAGAGDVNGDGYDDVMVGAWGQSSELGRAYVFHAVPTAGPQLAVEDTTVDETEPSASLKVVLWPPQAQAVSVRYHTADGAATAGSDFTGAEGDLTFEPGATVKAVTVPLLDDAWGEPQEDLQLTLSDAVNASIGQATGRAWIRDDDPPSVFVSDASIIEGSDGMAILGFTVSLLRPEEEWIYVDYATGDGTATADADYRSASGTASVPPRQTQATVTVIVQDDTLSEGNESFLLNLSAPRGAVIADGQGVGTIIDDEAAGYFPLTPCRAADTREPAGGPSLAANTTRSFPVAGLCGVPADAVAVAVNVTTVQQTGFGNLRVFPSGATLPLSSTLNFAPDRARANLALVSLGAEGRLAVRCDMPGSVIGRTQFILDVYGYLK
jgi:hypothetical protein